MVLIGFLLDLDRISIHFERSFWIKFSIVNFKKMWIWFDFDYLKNQVESNMLPCIYAAMSFRRESVTPELTFELNSLSRVLENFLWESKKNVSKQIEDEEERISCVFKRGLFLLPPQIYSENFGILLLDDLILNFTPIMLILKKMIKILLKSRSGLIWLH